MGSPDSRKNSTLTLVSSPVLTKIRVGGRDNRPCYPVAHLREIEGLLCQRDSRKGQKQTAKKNKLFHNE